MESSTVMAQLPPDSNKLPSTVAAIPMNASEFKQYVANLKSTSMKQKLMPLVRVCEVPSSANEGCGLKATFTAKSSLTGLKMVATTEESQVSSSSSKESSQEYVLAQELESAKASGIDSTFIDAQASSRGSKNDNNDEISSICLPHQDPQDSQYPVKGNAPTETTETKISQEQNAELMEECVLDKVEVGSTQTLPQAAFSAGTEGISSQTSQLFFSATSGTFDVKEKTSTEIVTESVKSIQAHVGSEDNLGSESDYSAPWDRSMPSSPSSLPTEAVLPSSDMALLTEDLVQESDCVDAALEGVEHSVSELQDVPRAAINQEASATSMEVVVVDDNLDSDHDRESGISLIDASIVLMQRSKATTKEEMSSEDSLSSEEY